MDLAALFYVTAAKEEVIAQLEEQGFTVDLETGEVLSMLDSWP
jgi:hypothetical protein